MSITSFGACIRIITGDPRWFLGLYKLFGLIKGLKTLKNPLTYLSSGIVCLSKPWNLSCTVKIWFKIGAYGGMNI
jgi:hypothetical protein